MLFWVMYFSNLYFLCFCIFSGISLVFLFSEMFLVFLLFRNVFLTFCIFAFLNVLVFVFFSFRNTPLYFYFSRIFFCVFSFRKYFCTLTNPHNLNPPVAIVVGGVNKINNENISINVECLNIL